MKTNTDSTDGFDFSDLQEDEVKPQAASGGKRKQLVIAFSAALVLILVLVVGYVLYLKFQPMLGSMFNQPQAAAQPTDSSADPQSTDVAAATEVIETVVAPATAEQTEDTATPEPEAAEPAAPSGDLLTPPDFGSVVTDRAKAESTAAQEMIDRATKLAGNMAIKEPYTWEYLEYDSSTKFKTAFDYYVRLVNREMGYRMTFNEEFDGGIHVFKFKQDARRVTIQFWEGDKANPPRAFIYYEGW